MFPLERIFKLVCSHVLLSIVLPTCKWLTYGAPRFCTAHSSLPSSVQSDLQTHRSILHSILLPLLQLRQQASHHAREILAESSRNCSSDLELAFKGSARGAFSWLQCFIVEEWDFCITSGCPACTVLKVLHAEPFIRIVIAGCRVSEYLQDLLEHRSPSSASPCDCDEDSGSDDDRNSGPTLPIFTFFLSALRKAVEEDEFWGLHFYEDIEARALDLEDGIKDLIAQCCSICNPRSASSSRTQSPETLPTARSTDPLGVPRLVLSPSSNQNPTSPTRVPAVRIKNSRLAKRQIKLQREEQEWMNKIIEACWKTMVVETAMQRRNGIRLEAQKIAPPLNRSASSPAAVAARMRSATA